MTRRLFLTALAAVFATGCTPPEPVRIHEEAVIVCVYDEDRWGMPDGTTVVAFPDGDRMSLVGKMGVAGEKIRVQVRTQRQIDEARHGQ